ncbi:hypothetical protein LZA78_02150 [Sinirhodobacter sp. WL0062]|uniref:Sulfotransferase domain-containing protein n=1 Tax=Rhodobacter flavimaris TaxID=2907145 RepID=A0ABS8YQX2_9RHOB|nr:hypothetical protein [Sinirhodobacter sp. WL0062]MCE5972294.1 hypothetical protein [Sinirhodobacter sp. WL0062]
MLVMHIGSPKTGTTSLQGFFHTNEVALRERGINYMRSGRSHIAHNPLPMAVAQRDAAAILDAIVAEHNAAPDTAHVISSEIMFRIIVARRLRETLPEALRDQTRVVCYLRRQDLYAEAIYKQLAKNGLVKLDRGEFLSGHLPKLKYSAILDTYAAIFGAQNIVVRAFERERFKGGDIVEDFACEHLGLGSLEGFSRQPSQSNPSLSVELTEMLGRIAYERHANPRQLVRELSNMDDPLLFSSRDTFSWSERREIMAYVASDNEKIRATYLPDHDTLFEQGDLTRNNSDNALAPERVAARAHAGALALARALQTLAVSAPPHARPNLAPQSFAPATPPGPAYPIWFDEICPAGPRKGYFHWLGHHGASFVDRGPEHLVVTFDNLHNVGDIRPERNPWAAKFCADNGWSHLGIISQRPDWLRDADLIAFFREQADRGFFERFRRVSFAGTSMGGFGAVAFSALSPGATVVAFSPQSTLDRQLVPWERRFAKGRSADWSLPFSDAAQGITTARKVWLIYDPFNAPDRRHVERLAGPNVTALRAPGLGHKTALALNRMGLLQPVIESALDGQLETRAFAQMIRARRSLFIYREEMAGYLTRRGQEARANRLRDLFKQVRRASGGRTAYE